MLLISIDTDSREPIYEQIYKYIRKEIVTGVLLCGTKLPSQRSLASNLSVSRNTVDMAYGQLVSEGYIEAVPQKGYYVSDLDTLYEEGIHVEEIKDDMEPAFTAEDMEEEGIDFSLSGVDMNYFPYDKWRKLMKESLIDDNKELFLSGKNQGDLELRKIICNYIHQSRGVKCKPSQIIIGAGSDYMLLLLTHILREKQHVAMENPAYKQAHTIFKSVGYDMSLLSLDDQGIKPEELEKSKANLVYTTPSHQFPMGMVMSATRRQKLLAWSFKAPGRYIIEDDYDSEFRYYGKPIPSLQSQDPFEKVIYMGTLSKVIAPGIRLSYMVLPEKLLQQYQENCSFYFSTVSRIDQQVIGRFFSEGYFERHLNRMRKVYKNKHEVLLRELKKSGLPMVIQGENAGLHVLCRFGKATLDAADIEEKLTEIAKEQHVTVYPLSHYYLREETRIPTVLLGFARLNEEDIVEGISRLSNVWNKSFTIVNGSVIFNLD